MISSSATHTKLELSLTEHTRPRLVKDATYVFPAGGATLETMAKNAMMQFAVGNFATVSSAAPGDK